MRQILKRNATAMTTTTTTGSSRGAVHTRDKCRIVNGALWWASYGILSPPVVCRHMERVESDKNKRPLITPEPLRIPRNSWILHISRICHWQIIMLVINHIINLGLKTLRKIFQILWDTKSYVPYVNHMYFEFFHVRKYFEIQKDISLNNENFV